VTNTIRGPSHLRRLQASPTPTPVPTQIPTFVPSRPTSVPTIAPSHPTFTPTAWPTLNSSSYQCWNWLELSSNSRSGWFDSLGTGTYYYISDLSGMNLISSGTLCTGTHSYQCWQVLPDGTYLLRIGGALNYNLGDVWSFCGVTGGSKSSWCSQFRGGNVRPSLSSLRNVIVQLLI